MNKLSQRLEHMYIALFVWLSQALLVKVSKLYGVTCEIEQNISSQKTNNGSCPIIAEYTRGALPSQNLVFLTSLCSWATDARFLGSLYMYNLAK